jgi:hypothetical protein
MIELVSADLIVIDKFPVFTFHGIKDLDPRKLQDALVIIDSHLYRVKRIETYAVMDATGHNFGLAVQREA